MMIYYESGIYNSTEENVEPEKKQPSTDGQGSDNEDTVTSDRLTASDGHCEDWENRWLDMLGNFELECKSTKIGKVKLKIFALKWWQKWCSIF